TNSNITNDEFIVIASSSAKQTSRAKVILQIGEFLPHDIFSTRKTLTMTQSLTIGSLLLLFVLLITLIALVINMRIKSRTKSKKAVYNTNKGNFMVIRNMNESSPHFENESQITPFPSSSYAKFKVLLFISIFSIFHFVLFILDFELNVCSRFSVYRILPQLLRISIIIILQKFYINRKFYF
ncbi:unnamed protein product, partial [Wuchereria bancrofti]